MNKDKESGCYRAGSAQGYLYMESRWEAMVPSSGYGGVPKRTTPKKWYCQPTRLLTQDPSEVHCLLVESVMATGSMRQVVRRQRTGQQQAVGSPIVAQGGAGEVLLRLRHPVLSLSGRGPPRRGYPGLALMVDGIELAVVGGLAARLTPWD